MGTGVKYDLDALFSGFSTVMHVPIFLAALIAIRAVPALLYRGLIPRGRIVVAGLMQATTLPFVVAATAIGLDIGVISAANAAALIAAGLLSVVIFPATALSCSAATRGRGRPRNRARAWSTPPPSRSESPPDA